MPSSRIPPLLEPYVYPPKDSLYLLTGVLNATTNWLVLRYLCAALHDGGAQNSRRGVKSEENAGDAIPEPGGRGTLGDGDGEKTAVVLVSWMRDFDFWRVEARRAVGLDLPKFSENGRFAFIDGLSCFFSPPKPAPPASPSPSAANPASAQPLRRGPIPLRQPSTLSPNRAIPPQTMPMPLSTSQADPPSKVPFQALESASLHALEALIQSTLSKLSSQKVFLILDHPSLLLTLPSTASSSHKQSSINTPLASLAITTSQHLLTTILSLRTHPQIHSTVITTPADSPFLHPSTQPTPLETENAAFITSLAHQADWLLSCRGLDTGWAKDVSGVLRLGRGGGWDGCCDSGEDEDWENGMAVEKEVLYYVGGDGGCKVFERGGGG
ncbi:hypothetical protein K402DRAFT_457022 [Aulographum hederae CBS 113979]|uniref:Uncharacterized protein n=1 Tax=Aulographum hederae CBS 113979 TaxID=1176131 RepID=A0A6G1GPT1_9PEZI|nr:hypothetical protein K402DRAFT_457022 [Aulographum hederae CBS 113979]